jgi:predicted PurR-regulated permease PerM
MQERKFFDITMASWIRAVVVLALALALFMVRDILLAILVAIILASAIEPVTRNAVRNGIPRLLSVMLTYIVLITAFAGVLYFLLLPLIAEVTGFIRTLTIYSGAASDGGLLSGMFRDQNIFGNLENSLISVGELSSYLNSLAAFFSQGIFSSLALIFGGLISFLLIVVLSFYLAVQEDGVGKFLRIITPYQHEERVLGIWRRSQAKIGKWIMGQFFASTLVGVLVYIGLTIVDAPHALLLAVIAGVFDLIPIVGPILASIPAIFIAIIMGDINLALIVAGIYLLVQQFENHVIYPLVHKKLVGIPPMVSIIAIAVGFKLAGFLGILIAVPMAAIVIELLSDYDEKKRPVHIPAESLT